MAKIILLVITLIFTTNCINAQLAVTPNNSASQLAATLAGQGLEIIGTPVLDCPSNAAGTFSNGLSSDIGIGTGIILTTGNINDFPSGTDIDASVLLTNDNGGPSMPDLDPLTNNTTYNGCKLTIQVKPICNKLSISYVFASEEYSDYVDDPSGVNDVFAFFVSGPNPLGGNYLDRNIAVVPGTNTPVSINTINFGYSLDGVAPSGPGTNSQYYNDNTNGTTNCYDGMTTKLEATIDVVPCQNYTIKLEIADVGDELWDSGVFLEANSVSCPINLVADAAPHRICSGQSTTLNGMVSGGTGTYSWSTGATGPTISVSPTTNTIYTCYYTFCGVTVEDTVNVQINPIAGATFQYSSTTYCKGTANPIPANVANGTVFSASPAGLVFASTATGEIDIAGTTSGTYTISLPGSGACPAPAQQTITIQDAPTAAITGAANICDGDSASVQIDFVGSAPYTYTLDGVSGSQSYTTFQNPHIINVGDVGTYTISALSDAGCAGTTSGSAIIGANPKPAVTFSGGGNYCQGSTPSPIVLTLTGTSPFEISYLENGSLVSQTINANTYSYTPTGDVNLEFVSILDATTCSDTLNQVYNITENPQPTGTIAGGGSVCFGLTPPPVTLNLTGNGPWTVNYTIDGNPMSVSATSSPFDLTDNLPGTYLITSITDSIGCAGTGSGSGNIVLFPGVTSTVTSTYETICPGETVTITGSGGTTANWAPVPTGSTASNYTMQTSPAVTTIYTLTVDDGNGCKDTSQVTVNVAPLPLSNFSNTEVCYGDVTTFTDSSIIGNGGTISTYLWYLEGGNTDNNQNPVFTFSSCGTYNVSLVTTTTDGCTDSVSKQVIVYCIPQPSFVIDDTVACENQTVYFNNTSIAPVGSASLWDYGFGEGTGTNTNESHAYGYSGTYTVTLNLTSPEGCQDVTTRNLTVIESPDADFTNDTVCLGTPTSFTDNSSSINSTITNYAWTFDLNVPANTSSIQNPTNTYLIPQSYNAQLIVTDANNCTDTIIKTVSVTPNPIADFTVNNVCLGNQHFYQNNSSISDNSTLMYFWDFESDGTPDANILNPVNTFNQSGVYATTLLVLSNNNCFDTTTKLINVYDYPIINFIADSLSGCEPLPVNLTNASSVTNPSSITQYSWYINNLLISTDENIYQNFGAGIYSIKLIAESNFGCRDSLEMTNYIESYPLPVADFDYTPKDASILDPIISFNDLSLGNIAEWYWSFGDTLGGTLITDHNLYPEYQYVDSGNYQVDLLVISDKGCVDTVVKIIRVNPEFIIYIPNAFTPNGDFVNNTFTPKGIGVNETKGYEFYIFDRWGNQIFKTTNWNEGWNGKFKNTGTRCMSDVYVYKINLEDVFGKKHQYYGQVSLVR